MVLMFVQLHVRFIKPMMTVIQGPSGRRSQPDGATKEDFFASILKSSEGGGASRDSARSRRQSRVSREIVSSAQGQSIILHLRHY